MVLRLGHDVHDQGGRLTRWLRGHGVSTVIIRPDRYVFDTGDDANALCTSLFTHIDGDPVQRPTTGRTGGAARAFASIRKARRAIRWTAGPG